MFRDIIIGRYLPGVSPLHRMNPQVKIILTILYMALLFVINKPLSFAVLTVYTVAVALVGKVPFKMLLKGIKPMLWIFVFTAVINLFMTDGETVFSFSLLGLPLNITREGAFAAAKLVVRLLYLAVGSSFLTLTTPPVTLTDGIEKFLSPLGRIKIPYREIALMMTIAIRFIPTLAEEADKIMKAQTARGADFETKNIIKRAASMIPLLVPLFVSVFSRADDLAEAMEARCYNGGGNRTKMKQTPVTKTDLAAVLIFAAAAAVLITAEFIIEI